MSSKKFFYLLLGFSASFSLFTLLLPTSLTAHASSHYIADPLVVVSVDKTQSSSCTETFQANIGTPQLSKRRILCPPGTIMSNSTIRYSQAIALHKAYVKLPSLQASAVNNQQIQQQILKMDQSSQIALRSQMTRYIHPATGCGNNGIASLRWNYLGGVLNASITFYKSTDCSTVYFDDAQLNTTVRLNSDAVWAFDMYAGNTYNQPSCPNVYAVGHRFHLVGTSAPSGYYYENWLYWETNCITNLIGGDWDNMAVY